VPDALDFVQQAAEALAVAHHRGIVHCDLKPENLLLVPDHATPRGERVKVLDFGIARLRGQGQSDPSTSGLIILGSPFYMAPEQCGPEGTEVDQRADIYSLGALLYHALCGVPPFVDDAVGGLLARHLLDAPPPPRSIDPDLPLHVEAAILQALAKRPEERFLTMGALVTALRAGPHRPRPSHTQRVERAKAPAPHRWRRRLTVAIACAGLAAAALHRDRLALSIRAESMAFAARLQRSVGIGRVPSAPSPDTTAARPIIVPLPEDEAPAPRRSVRRPAISRASIGGLGDVLGHEELWGRRH
jgi:serine/threonine-protein kinase